MELLTLYKMNKTSWTHSNFTSDFFVDSRSTHYCSDGGFKFLSLTNFYIQYVQEVVTHFI